MTYLPHNRDGHTFDGRLIRSGVCPYDRMAGEDELGMVTSPMGAFGELEISDLLDFPHMGDPANLNLVPWISLPRRARHRNEQARPFRQ